MMQTITEEVNTSDIKKKFLSSLQMFVTVDEEYAVHAENISSDFVRKYTHARIGGFISGQYQRHMEKKGKRTLGGASLRDSLYSFGTKSAKHESSASASRGRGGAIARPKSVKCTPSASTSTVTTRGRGAGNTNSGRGSSSRGRGAGNTNAGRGSSSRGRGSNIKQK